MPVKKKKFNNARFERAVQVCKERNRENLSRERLARISKHSFVYYNSLVVLCGPQGSGKTWTSAKECARISHVDPQCHLVVIVTKPENSDDPTVATFSELFNVPVVMIPETSAEEYVRNLLECKKFYSTVRENGTQLQPDEHNWISNTLYVDDFSEWLHTLIIFNDIAKSKLFRPGEYFPRLMATLRHAQCTVFLNIQFWRGLVPEVKANLTSAVIFGGFSRQQFVQILYQLPSVYEWRKVYPLYQTLRRNDKMIFTNGEFEIQKYTEPEIPEIPEILY